MARTLLEISRELAALSQTGLAYSRDPYDRERFERLREIASELLRNPDEPGKADFAWPPEEGYGTPKVDVRALVIRGEEILLIREKTTGRWAIPGGWADVNLIPADNVRKECLEEACLPVTVDRLVSVMDLERGGYRPLLWSAYKLFFLCSPEAGAVPAAGDEVLEVRYFPRHALPEDLDRSRVSPEEIERGFFHREDPSLPTFFET